MSYDTILCSVGVKYSDYNTEIIRTLFIDPTNDQKNNYVFMYNAFNLIVANLKSGI